MIADNKMDMPMFTEKVAQQLKEFAQQCMNDSSLLHDPKLSFIKELIEYYGGKIPEAKADNSSDAKCGSKDKEEEPEPEPISESEESDLELDMTGVIGLYTYIFYQIHVVLSCSI